MTDPKAAERVTAPRTSPLTEEREKELRRRACLMLLTVTEAPCAFISPTETVHSWLCNETTAALLRVDSEARADLDEAVRLLDKAADHLEAAGDIIRDAVSVDEDDAECERELIAELRAFVARHPTPSTPTTTEET